MYRLDVIVSYVTSEKLHLKILYKSSWSKSMEQEADIKQGKLRLYALFTGKPFFQKEIYLETVKFCTKTQMSGAAESKCTWVRN